MVDVQHPWQGHDFVAVDEYVGVDLACGEATGHGNEVFQHEPAVGLIDDAVDHVGYRDPLHRVEVDVPAHVGHRLQHNAPDRRVFQPELDNGSNFVFVYSSLHRRHQNGVQTGFVQPVQGAHLQVQQVLAPQGLVGFRA